MSRQACTNRCVSSVDRYLDLCRCSNRQMQRTFARLRGAPEKALGYRVHYVKAKRDYPGDADADADGDEKMVVRKGESLAICASTPEGWEALGNTCNHLYCPPSLYGDR